MKVWLLAWGQRRDKDSKPEMLEQCGIYSRQQPPLNGSNSFFFGVFVGRDALYCQLYTNRRVYFWCGAAFHG